MAFRDHLLKSWQQANGLSVALWPLSLLYRLVFSANRFRYRIGLAKSYRAPVPVIVVGNLSVGGTGKTPLVIFLVNALREAGYKPGVISRGYGGQAKQYPLEVGADTPVTYSGDEPALIVRRTAVPMCVGPDRKASIEYLLERHELDLIISDDGLQHHALQRDIELCIVDKTSLQKNSYLLPAGPWREPLTRLNSVDLVVYHGDSDTQEKQISMQLMPAQPLPVLADSKAIFDSSKPIQAIAGIGNPQRFFDTCVQLGLKIDAHAFPDHHKFLKEDIEFGETQVLMTEKDAVKVREIADHRHWYLPVDAKLSAGFIDRLIEKL